MSTIGDVAPGVVLDGRFRLESELGSGGMGRVWRAHDRLLDRPVAIKMLRADLGDDAAERIRHEALATARVRDHRIVTVLDFRRSDHGLAYLVLEVFGGRTLADELRVGALAPERFAQLIHDLVGGLAAAHAAGVLHQDVKPSNVLVAPNGYRISDFGVASFGDEPDDGPVYGTPRYVAPERLTGAPASARADVFSAAAVLREAMPQGAAPHVPAVVERALDPDPSRRPADAGALLALLAPTDETIALTTPGDATALMTGPGSEDDGTLAWPAPPRPNRARPPETKAGSPPHRRRPATVAAAVGSVVVALLLAALMLDDDDATAPVTDGTTAPSVTDGGAASRSVEEILERLAEVGG